MSQWLQHVVSHSYHHLKENNDPNVRTSTDANQILNLKNDNIIGLLLLHELYFSKSEKIGLRWKNTGKSGVHSNIWSWDVESKEPKTISIPVTEGSSWHKLVRKWQYYTIQSRTSPGPQARSGPTHSWSPRRGRDVNNRSIIFKKSPRINSGNIFSTSFNL